MLTPPLNNSIKLWLAVTVVVGSSLSSRAGAVSYELGASGWTAIVDQGDINVITETFTGAAVVIRIEKTFEGGPDGSGLMPALYIAFHKDQTEAAGQIIINDEFITNNTGVDWIDFHLELEVSSSNPEAGFSSSLIPSGDSFDSVVLSGSNGYDGAATQLDFSDGLVAQGEDFRPGYDSGGTVIIADPAMAVGEEILLKEYPTIPEPATLGLLLVGLVGVMRPRRSV